MHRHAPPDYDCPFCAFAGGEERPPRNLLEDVVWRDEGTTAWMNPRWWENNLGADQEVWHYHLHVFPRHRNDGLYGAGARLTKPRERSPYADRLRAAL